MKGLTEKQKIILNKIEQIEARNYYVERCIAVKICPECGKSLKLKPGKLNRVTYSYTEIWKCSCGYEILLV